MSDFQIPDSLTLEKYLRTQPNSECHSGDFEGESWNCGVMDCADCVLSADREYTVADVAGIIKQLMDAE